MKQDTFDSQENGFFTKLENGKEVPDIHGLADHVRLKKTLKYVKQNDCFYLYIKGYFKAIHPIDVEGFLFEKTQYKIKSASILRNFYVALRSAVACDDQSDNSQTSLINLENGILNLKTMELLSHSVNQFFNYQLPYKYDPTKRWNNDWEWLNWLRGIFPDHPEEAIEFVQAMMGYIIMGGFPFLHKAFAFVGDGSNGKSVLMQVIQKLVGKASYASVPIQNLNNEFKAVLLVGKKVNLLSEIDPKILEASEFKKAVSGEELLAGHKYKPNFLFNCQARFVFNCNKLPNFGENNNAIQRRICFLNFNREFSEDEASTFNEEVFIENLDVSMLLNWCIEGLQKVRTTQKLPFNPFQLESSQEMQRQTDSVYAFMEECLRFDELKIGWENVRSIYNNYVSFCEKSFFKPKNVNNFSRDLRIMLLRSEEFSVRVTRYNTDKKQWQFRHLRAES